MSDFRKRINLVLKRMDKNRVHYTRKASKTGLVHMRSIHQLGVALNPLIKWRGGLLPRKRPGLESP